MVSSAPGKVILFGEHAVVYGKTAVGAAVSDLRIVANVVSFLSSFMSSVRLQVKTRLRRLLSSASMPSWCRLLLLFAAGCDEGARAPDVVVLV